MADYTVYAGDSLEITVTVTDSVTGAVVNLTGGTAEYRIARTPTSTAVLTKTSTGGQIALGGTAGTALITIAAGDTDDFAGNYYHEMVIWDSNGAESTVVAGTVVFSRTLID